jgi:hypothetical protein
MTKQQYKQAGRHWSVMEPAQRTRTQHNRTCDLARLAVLYRRIGMVPQAMRIWLTMPNTTYPLP